MLFNSFEFVILVIITFGLYYTPRLIKVQAQLLIFSSFVFYAWSNVYLLTLLIFSAGTNAYISRVLVSNDLNKKWKAWFGVLLNLCVLGFFKYANLISITFFNGYNTDSLLTTLPLPIGISFYTFQGISLIIDTYRYRNKEKRTVRQQFAPTHYRNVFLFITFFPQLVAGPIVKAKEFLPQIKRKYLADIDYEFAFKTIVLGYFLKNVVADNLKDFTFWMEYPHFQNLDSYTLIFMLFGFSGQIFADFAGYSLIAVGISSLFGYRLKANFNKPYLAQSFKDFWKRWHISLSSFLQEYLYIPLGGNRKGKLRTYVNLFITMSLGGLWHGAAWSYAVWGFYHGLLLAIERYISSFSLKRTKNFPIVFKSLFVFCFISLGWLLFKLPEFDHVLIYLTSIYSNRFMDVQTDYIAAILLYTSPVFLYHIFNRLSEFSFFQGNRYFKPAVYALMIFLIVTNSGIPGTFIYFQF